MAKFLKIDAGGRVAEESGVTTSAGSGDVGKLPQLDAAGKLDASLMPAGIGIDTVAATASEALAAGDFVNLHDVGGVLNARKADASAANAGKAANGYVLAGVANAAVATVYFEGRNSALTGLTVAAEYWLSGSVPGGVTTTPPTTAGHLMQRLGRALSTSSVDVEIDQGVIRA